MSSVHQISVVVPVYRGASTLPGLIDELSSFREDCLSEQGHRFRVAEVLLVHDAGPDASDVVIRDLVAQRDWVRPVWLTRNFGQHAATMAGMASSGGDWIVTLDEDGQHDPAFISSMLDTAMADQAGIVYADPSNAAPHGPFRNVTSRAAKRLVDLLTGEGTASKYHSFRLILGETGRNVAAYAGAGVYLDVALGWIEGTASSTPVILRSEGGRPSGYSTRTLLSHFWRMVLTGGTRLLRSVSVVGIVAAVLGFVAALALVAVKLWSGVDVAGWASVMALLSIGIGAILFSLGVVAEYLGVAVNMAMGKPLYVITVDRQSGPLGRQIEPRR